MTLSHQSPSAHSPPSVFPSLSTSVHPGAPGDVSISNLGHWVRPQDPNAWIKIQEGALMQYHVMACSHGGASEGTGRQLH